MDRMRMCSQCLRTVRKQPKLDVNQVNRVPKQSRYLSTTSNRSQQQAPLQQTSQETTDPAIRAFMPTTAPTITSNVAADAPQPGSISANTSKTPTPPPAPSTSEMQRRISSNLSSPRLASALTHKLATSLRSAAKSSTETYITYGLTEVLFKSCAAQAPYTVPDDLRMGIYTGKGPPKNAGGEDIGVPDDSVAGSKGANSWWFKTLGLEPTFSTWSQVSFLHMYILTVKLRTLPDNKTHLDYQRYLLEHFSNEAEDKMALLHGMNARGIRNKYLKDLFVQWRGIMYAYDQGLVAGDAVLAGAVWRNLWKADEDVDWEKVALVVGFMRRAIAGLADVSINDIAAGLKEGSQYWEQAQEGLDVAVNAQTRGMKEPLAQESAGQQKLQ